MKADSLGDFRVGPSRHALSCKPWRFYRATRDSRGTSGSALKGCLVCHRLASSIVKVSKSCLRADSQGSSVGPVNHVLRGDTWSHSPESFAIASSCLGEVSNAPPGPLGNRLTRRPTCRVVLFWKMSRPFFHPSSSSDSFSPFPLGLKRLPEDDTDASATFVARPRMPLPMGD